MAPATSQAETTRTLNFYVVASLVVSATSTVPGLWTAAGWAYTLDDVALAATAASAIIWYGRGRNRGRPSFVPLRFLLLAAVTKLIAVSLTHNQGAAYGGDATVASFLTCTLAVTVWQLVVGDRAAARAIRLRDTELLVEALRQRERYGRPPRG